MVVEQKILSKTLILIINKNWPNINFNKVDMIRRGILALRPAIRTTKFYLQNRVTLPAYRTTPVNFFSTQKGNDANQSNKVKPEQAEKQVKQEKGPKLSEMSVEDLVEMNTDDSLREVEKRAKKLQEAHKKNLEKIKQIEERLTFAEKHHADLTIKEEQLLANINQQEAELIRIKKRAEKELEDSKDFAITKLAKEIMEVADNVKRCKVFAEEKIKENPDDKYLQKIIFCFEQMHEFLKLYDIEEFDPMGQPFDPNTSESLVTIPCPPGYTVDHVACTMQTGYRIKNRLLRSARVGIFV